MWSGGHLLSRKQSPERKQQRPKVLLRDSWQLQKQQQQRQLRMVREREVGYMATGTAPGAEDHTMECGELPSRRSTNDRFAEAACCCCRRRSLLRSPQCLGNAFARRARHQTKNVNTGTDRLPGAMLRHRRATSTAAVAAAAGQAKSRASRSASSSSLPLTVLFG